MLHHMTTEIRQGEGEGKKTGCTEEVKTSMQVLCVHVCACRCVYDMLFTIIIYVIASFGSSNSDYNTVLLYTPIN